MSLDPIHVPHHFAAIERYLLDFVMILLIFFLLLFFPFCSPIFFHLFPEKNYLSPHFFNLSSVYPHTTKKTPTLEFAPVLSNYLSPLFSYDFPSISMSSPFFLTGPFEDPQIAKEKRIATT